jgi:hypothetical protein
MEKIFQAVPKDAKGTPIAFEHWEKIVKEIEGLEVKRKKLGMIFAGIHENRTKILLEVSISMQQHFVKHSFKMSFLNDSNLISKKSADTLPMDLPELKFVK